MKKGLEKLTNSTVNIATNTLLGVGALEYMQHLSEVGESGYITGMVGAAAGLGIYGLNKIGAIDSTRSTISNLSKKVGGKLSKVVKIAGLAGYLAASGIMGYNTGEKIVDNFYEKENVVPDNGKFLPRNTTLGKFQRTYRWDEFLDKTENKYNIEKGILGGLSMREGYGNPLQLNSSGDGGAGMIQMQPGVARYYGLKTYGTSKATGRDKSHGRKLLKLLKSLNYNYEKAIKYDDRFNPKKNIDAAGKMIKDMYKKYGNWDKAISAYNLGPKRSSRLPTKTRHVKAVRNYQKFYNKHDKTNY